MGLRDLVALTLIGAAAAGSGSYRNDNGDAVERARAYAGEWRRALLAMVAEESYTQTAEVLPGRSRRVHQQSSQQLVSDVLFVRPKADDAWLMFRDVMAVDGEAIPDRQRRFDALFLRPDADLIANARRIADESARFNLGGAVRNINTPVAALIFLEPQYESSTRWRMATAAAGDPTSLVLSFDQRRAPFAVRQPDGSPQPMSGRMWIEDSGRIVATELTAVESRLARTVLSTRVRRARTRITATFGPANGIEFWVPRHMEEEIVIDDGYRETITGRAVYTNHRLFQTSVRIIKPQ